MAQPEEVRDPSMEEILASIRRIIAEDSGDPSGRPAHLAVVPDPEPESASSRRSGGAYRLKARATAPAPAEPAPVDEVEPEPPAADEVETAPYEEPESVAWASPEEAEDPVIVAASESIDEAGYAEEEPFAPPAGPDLEAITEAMSEVREEDRVSESRRLLSPEADQAVHSAFNQLASTILSSQARTLEDLVKDMMRPMLKNWLDDNLPVLVERLVREEIERVSRGRR